MHMHMPCALPFFHTYAISDVPMPFCPLLSYAHAVSGFQVKSLDSLKKTRLCQEFVSSGACKYGERCTFAHGDHELRASVPMAGGGGEVSPWVVWGRGEVGCYKMISLLVQFRDRSDHLFVQSRWHVVPINFAFYL